MANTLVQIRRSNTAASPSPTANLNSGELGFSYNSNSLFIGAQTGTTGTSYKIGGAKFGYLDNAGNPGVQTSNSTVILDANSFTTNVYTQGLVIAISTASITAPAISSINAVANSTVLGAATNTELTTTWAIKTYVDTKTGGSSTVGGANTQVLFNDSTLANGVAGFTFNKITNNATIANNLSVASVNVNTFASLNSTALWISTNSTVNTVITATTLTQSNTTAVPLTANDIGIWSTGIVNAASHTVGATFTANSTLVNTAAINVVNQVNTATLYAATSANVGTAFVANATGVWTTGTVNSASSISSSMVVRGSAVATGEGGQIVLGYGNNLASSITTQANNTFNIDVVGGNTGSTPLLRIFTVNNDGTTNNIAAFANTGRITFGSAAENTETTVKIVGTANVTQLLNASGNLNAPTINASANIVVGTVGTNAVLLTTTAINVGNATVNATINSTTFSGTSLTANNATNLGGTAAASYVQNTDSRTLSGNLTFTGANHSITSTNTSITSNVVITGLLNASGNTTLSGALVTLSGTNTSITSNVVVAGVNFSTSSNTTFSGANVSITGTNTYITSNVVITSSNLDAASAVLRIRDIVASGNLTVQGTLSTIDTTSLQVKDNFIELADQNNLAATDAVDFGWYGVANISSTTTYFGMGRIAGSSNTFTLFSTTTKPASAGTLTGLTTASLQAYLSSGAFTSNSSTVTITANSTINVNITANTLSLSTALTPGNGGTGLSSYTTGDLIYASGAGTLAKLGIAANGNVLQIVNNLPAYGGLDGGTF